MNRIKIGGCISLENIKEALGSNLDFVDLSGVELSRLKEEEFLQLLTLLTEGGKPCLGIHGAFPGSVKLCGVGYEGEKLDHYLEVLIPRAEQLSVKYLSVGSPDSRMLNNSISYEAAVSQLQASLTCICRKSRGINVLLEGLNSMETNFIHTTKEAYEIIRNLPEKNIGLVCDWYHVLIQGEDVAAISPEIWKNIRYFHIADPNGRRYLSEKTEEAVWAAVRKGFHMAQAENIAIEVSEPYSSHRIDCACDQIRSKLM